MLYGLTLFLQLFADLIQCFAQVLRIDRLDKILPYTESYALTGIFELIVPAQNDYPYPRHLRTQYAAQLYSVHEGHSYVRDHNIGIRITDDGKRHFSVRSFSHKGIGSFIPRKRFSYSLSDHYLIISQKYFHLQISPLESCKER